MHNSRAEAPGLGAGRHIKESVTLRYVLDTLKPEKFHNPSEDTAAVTDLYRTSRETACIPAFDGLSNIMGENNYLKIGAFVAFILFAAVSCWATAESLHLLLPSWPVAMCWIVTVGFFFIASWGSKLIVDSCNQTIFVEKRGMKLVIGIIILVIFWFVCSFPTNTHTFFYRSVIDEEVTKDISTTKGYLSQIATNAVINQKIQDTCTKLDIAVYT